MFFCVFTPPPPQINEVNLAYYLFDKVKADHKSAAASKLVLGSQLTLRNKTITAASARFALIGDNEERINYGGSSLHFRSPLD